MFMTLAGRRKKQVRYLKGIGEDTRLSKDPSQLIVDYPIREDIPGDIEEVNLLQYEVSGIHYYC